MSKGTQVFNEMQITHELDITAGKPLVRPISPDVADWPRETLTRADGSQLRYELLSQFHWGDMLVRYQLNIDSGQVGLSLIPIEKADLCVARRMSLRGNRRGRFPAGSHGGQARMEDFQSGSVESCGGLLYGRRGGWSVVG